MDIPELYARLLKALKKGDDEFIPDGVDALIEAYDKGAFSKVSFEPAQEKSYTRRKVIGSTQDHLVIRAMEWNKKDIPPHEHHGRPCFEIVLEGMLEVKNWKAQEIDGLYQLTEQTLQFLRLRDVAIVTPQNNIHSVSCPDFARSIHVYPIDMPFTYAYEQQNGLWLRKQVPLRE